MIGGVTKSATSILRQLIDAGTLANLPAGFKSRGLNIQRADDPIQPGNGEMLILPEEQSESRLCHYRTRSLAGR